MNLWRVKVMYFAGARLFYAECSQEDLPATFDVVTEILRRFTNEMATKELATLRVEVSQV